MKVVMLAQEESRRLGSKFVGTEHVLLGLRGEGAGIAAQVLRAHKLSLRKLREEVGKLSIIGVGPSPIEIPFTVRAKTLLEVSWDTARELGHTYIGTEHLLLGLLSTHGCVAIQSLERLNIDVERIKTDVFEAMSLAAKRQQAANAIPPSKEAEKKAEIKASVTNLFSDSSIKAMELAQEEDRKSTRLNSSHSDRSRMPSSA